MNVISGVLLSIMMFGLVWGFVSLSRAMRELHQSTNSRLDQLLVKTDMLARAEGFKAGEEHHLQGLRDAAVALEKK